MRCRLRSLAAALLALSACRSDPAGPGSAPSRLTTLPRPLTVAEARVRDASNRFAVGLLREASRGERDANVFVSPLSASMALGMTLNGARGTTLDSMRVALGVAGVAPSEINDGYRQLIALLRGLDPATDLRIANSVWSRAGFAVEPAFTALLREHFGATARELDFAAPGAPATINGWVRENTAGRIAQIVDGPIDSDVMMYLINAVYFDGRWRDAFDRARTHDAQFATPAGSRPVRMMHKEGPATLLREPGLTIVELPYGNGAYAMTIVLPDSGGSVEALVDALTPERWDAWARVLADTTREQRVELYLPRFRLEWDRLLNDPLTALGMGIAFDPHHADFTGINRRGGLYVSRVRQKTYVDVHEEGTEAAAVTSVEIRVVCLCPPTTPVVRVDRPFVVAIRERLSGTILFAGKVTAP
jgi:serpin B